MLENYANQDLSWKSVLSLNKYNEPTYSTTTIKGRKETSNKMVRTASGQETIAVSCVFTKSLVLVNDLIDGKLVIMVDNSVDLDGTTLFYEVYLK